VELRSIDYVPPEERHGRVRDQFTLWFPLNANIFALVLGGVMVFLGLQLPVGMHRHRIRSPSLASPWFASPIQGPRSACRR